MHKRILSIVLCLAMMMSFAVPAYATNGTAENGDIYIADDVIMSDGQITTSYDADGNIVIKMNSDETEAPAEETEAHAEETEAPAEETEAPAEETEAPTEETEAPVEETEAPVEETEAEKVFSDDELIEEEEVVTDEAKAASDFPTLTIGKGTTNMDAGSNGVEDWYLLGEGSYGYAYTESGGDKDSCTEDYDIVIDGTNATNKTFEIVLQRLEWAKGRTLYLDLHTIWIKGGANLVFRLGSTITDDTTDQIIIRQVRGHQKNNESDKWWFGELFWVESGSLNLQVLYNEDNPNANNRFQKDVKMVFDWDSDYNNVPSGNGPKALVSLREDATSFKANQCVFQNTLEAAIVCRSAGLSEFTMTDCEFENTNKASGNGSAIYFMNKVDDDSEDKNEYYDYTQIHNFSLTNCTFNNCTAGGSGGAISIRSYVHKGTISGCTFNNCTSESYGGAIELSGNLGSFSISDSSFTDCTAQVRGGGVAVRSIEMFGLSVAKRWSRSNNVSFSGCSFTRCKSIDNHGGGIGIQAQIHTLSVSDCDFVSCTAQVNGGGISIDAADLPKTFKNEDVVNFPNWCAGINEKLCTTCTGYGSVMSGNFNWGTAQNPIHKSWIDTVNITNNCTFTDCSAIGTLETKDGVTTLSGGNGGSIEFADGLYVINKATISGININRSKSPGEGTAIFWSGCYVKEMEVKDSTIQNCKYTNEQSPSPGGTVKVTGNTSIVLKVDSCKFLKNQTHSNGGGLYWNASKSVSGLVCKATVNNCTFDGNSALNFGGGIYSESDIEITKCNIKNNKAYMGGGIAQQVYNNPGARMLEANGVTELKLDPNTWVHHNTANLGGGISIRANETGSITDGSPIPYTVRFELNGAAVYQNTANKKADGTCGHGGGIYFICETYDNADKQAEVDKYTKQILINAGTGTAAAVYDNTAQGNGGGIYMESSQNTELRVQGGHISSNEAANGGGIYMTGKNATCYVEGGIIGGAGKDSNGQELANVASGNGGGIAISGGAKIEMNKAAGATTGGTISYNKAYAFGGGIWLDAKGTGTDDVGNKIIINEGIITSNTASGAQTDDNGGGIALLNGSEAELNGGTISKNHADYRGGGIFARGATVKLNGSDIFENTGKCSGGGILGDRGSLITINSGDIYKNSTSNGWGGGIYLTDSGTKVTMNGGNIYENATTVVGGCGGGINAEVNCTVTISGGNIYKNTASLYGGGVHSYNNASVNVVGGSIHENTAVYGGGIAVRNNSTCTVTKSKTDVGRITKNTAKNGGGVFVASGADLTVHDGYIIQNIAQGKPAAGVTTAYYDTADGGVASSALLGVGGGIYVADGSASNNPATFTLTGDNVAIYGNIAEFAADDVFANGNFTKLNVPTVAGMNLEGYDFPAAGWVEDYPVNDSNYQDGLSLGYDREQNVVSNGSNVYRYRFSRPGFRIVVPEANVTADKFAPNVANEYVCMTLGIPVAEPDVVVVDFGLPVNIDVSANDLIIDVEPIHGFVVDEHVNSKGYNEASPNSDGSCSLCNTEGTQNSSGGFVLNDDKHSATFTPSDMNFSGAQTVNYVVHYAIKDSNGADKFYHFYSTVTAIPATNIYYEDSFLEFVDSKVESATFGKWVEVTDETAATASTDVTQQQDRPGEDVNNALGALDADNVYGYDEAYKNCTTYSLGSAMKVTVDKSTGSANNAPTANFTFTGTGFDVVSLTDSDSGCLWVTVTDKNEDTVKSIIVSNYYGYTCDLYYVTYTYKNDNWVKTVGNKAEDDVEERKAELNNPVEGTTVTGIEYVWTVNTESSDCLYQVPVIKVEDLAYGEYNVELKVVYLKSQDMQKDNRYTVWLDAIRIYNPAKNDDVANDAYEKDGEANPYYVNIKKQIINPDQFINGNYSGVGYVDGYHFSKNESGSFLAHYENAGPNNEAYLTKGDGFAFKLRYPCNQNDTVAPSGAALQIGAKLANGDCAVLTSSHEGLAANVNYVIHSGTSMFYKLFELRWYPDKVSETVENKDGSTTTYWYWETKPIYLTYGPVEKDKNLAIFEGVVPNGILSLTDLKVTVPGAATSNASEKAAMYAIYDGEVGNFIEDVINSSKPQNQKSINLAYPTLSLEDEVKYNFYYTVKNIDVAVEDMGLITWSTKPEDATFENAETVIPGASYNAATGEYMVRTNGIPAKKLGDDVYFRVYAKLSDGSYVYSQMTYYSAKIYAFDRLDNSNSADMKAACVAMLNYGAAAQKHFGYKTDVLMNADLTAEQKALADAYSSDMVDALPAVDAAKAADFVSNGGFSTGYPSVSFEGAFAINYYFVPNKAIDGDLTLYCWDLETYNSVDKLTVDNATAKIVMSQTITGEYFATYTGIAAKQIDEAVFVAGVYESEGVRYSTNVVPYSVGAYCADRVAYGSDTMKVFAAETAVFGHYAEIYFDNLNK